MKIYRIAEGIDSQTESLFDYLVGASERNPSFKDGWLERAEQVLNGKVTNESFAIWLNRRVDNAEWGKLAEKLANEYFSEMNK